MDNTNENHFANIIIEANKIPSELMEFFEPIQNDKKTIFDITTGGGINENHFASYPQELIETPIRAGCPKNGTVIDPFFGSGTTGIVSRKLDRNYIGIELNPEYIDIAKKRLYKELGMFN